MIKDVILLLVGIIVGSMNAIGGGGMLIGYPVLLAFGLSPLVANITSNVVVLPGQLTAVFGYRKYLNKLPRRFLILLASCVIGAIIGALLLRHTSSNRFKDLAPVLVFCAVLLFTFQPFIRIHLHQHLRKRNQSFKTIFFLALALLPTAIYGGYFGAGFGFIMLAFLSFTSLRDIHRMNGLKNLAATSIVIMSIICLYTTHLINWRYGIAMGIGNAIGGYTGVRLSLKFSTHTLRIVVIVIGFLAAGYLAASEY